MSRKSIETVEGNGIFAIDLTSNQVIDFDLRSEKSRFTIVFQWTGSGVANTATIGYIGYSDKLDLNSGVALDLAGATTAVLGTVSSVDGDSITAYTDGNLNFESIRAIYTANSNTGTGKLFLAETQDMAEQKIN